MLRARCEVQVAPDTTKTDRNGRWLVYSGIAMTPQLSEGGEEQPPKRLVIDLATLKSPDVLPALLSHMKFAALGRWDAISIDPETGVAMDLHITLPTTPAEAEVLRDGTRIAAHLRNRVPFQASMGIEMGEGSTREPVPRGTTVEVNGQTFSGDGDLELEVWRGASLFETSVIDTFDAADPNSGVIAARSHPTTSNPKDRPMKNNLKALLAKHPKEWHARIAALCADDDKTDDQIDSTVTSEAMAALVAENTRLAAENATLTEAAAARADDGTNRSGDDKDHDGQADDEDKTKAAARTSNGSKKGVAFGPVRAAAGNGKGEQPATFIQAMGVVAKANAHLKGAELAKATAKAYPDLDPNKNSPIRAAILGKRQTQAV